MPGRHFHVPAQFGGDGLVSRAKPLKKAGALPPLRVLCLYHVPPHQVTVVVGVAWATVTSPSVNAPRSGKAKTVISWASVAGRCSASPAYVAVSCRGPRGVVSAGNVQLAPPETSVVAVQL